MESRQYQLIQCNVKIGGEAAGSIEIRKSASAFVIGIDLPGDVQLLTDLLLCQSLMDTKFF